MCWVEISSAVTNSITNSTRHKEAAERVSGGYYMEINSQRNRMIKNCDRILRLAGLGKLTEVLTLDHR
jgi:hypothetical protein